MGSEPEQFSHSVILHCHVQIRRRDGDVGVPSGVAGFRKRSATVSSVTLAIDADVGAADVAGLIGSQEREDGGHFLDGTHPPARLHFVERRYAGDPTNWWIPNRACSEAMLRSAGFELAERPEEEVYVCRRVAPGAAERGDRAPTVPVPVREGAS